MGVGWSHGSRDTVARRIAAFRAASDAPRHSPGRRVRRLRALHHAADAQWRLYVQAFERGTGAIVTDLAVPEVIVR